MSGRKAVITQTPIKADNTFNVQYDDHNTFGSVIQKKGYRVTIERAIKCPCKAKGDSPLPECANCFGSGWAFINKTNSHLILQSLSTKTKYTQWNEQDVGTVSLTGLAQDRLAFMDRITVLDGINYFSEVLHCFTFEGKTITKSIYAILEIDHCYLFSGVNAKYTPLVREEDYLVKDNTLVFLNTKVSAGSRLTVRYAHNPIFHILDLDRSIRVSDVNNDLGLSINQSFPVHGVAKRAHYIFDSMNYESNIDNQGDLMDNTLVLNVPSC